MRKNDNMTSKEIHDEDDENLFLFQFFMIFLASQIFMYVKNINLLDSKQSYKAIIRNSQ